MLRKKQPTEKCLVSFFFFKNLGVDQSANEIFALCIDLQLQYCVNKSLIQVPLMIKFNPALGLATCYLKIGSVFYSNIALSPKCYITIRLSNQNCVRLSYLLSWNSPF
jgi:hypothetical protein